MLGEVSEEAHHRPVDEDDVVGEAYVLCLGEPARYRAKVLMEEPVVAAEAVEVFGIEHPE